MKIHRFIGNFDLKWQEVLIDDPAIIHQITKVLRLKNGAQIILGNGRGLETLADIKKIQKGSVLVSLKKKIEKEEGTPRVSLYLAILKKENFEWVAQKATEIGVSAIIPVKTSRVVKQNLNEERIRKIIREAAEQSGKIILPKLEESLSLEEAFNQNRKSGEQWFLDEEGTPLRALRQSKKLTSISLFVGPEGGWTKEEKELARKKDLKMISISSHTLRAETAAIIAAYIGTEQIY